MPDWLYTVEITSVDPDLEDEWNTWYDEVHLPEMTRCPGWLSGERYVHIGEAGRRYLTVYALSGPQALDTDEFRAHRGWAKYTGAVEHSAYLWRRRDAK
jgi:hypothetical protein